MKSLVTGATGFVGSAVARCLLEAGHDVRVLVREGSDRRNVAGLDVEESIGDLRERASLDRAAAGCAAVFHVAADYRLWVPDPDALEASNVAGSVNVVEAALGAGVERVVYTSSVATLGLRADGTPADEGTPVSIGDMVGAYKRSKYVAEEAVRRLVRDRGAPVVIVNPAAPVGPRDAKPTPTGRIVVDAAAGRMPAYVDTGLNVVHVDDVAEGHRLALERGRAGERYVLGGENMTLREILSVACAEAGRVPPRVRLPHRAVLPIAYAAESWCRVFGGEPFATVDGVRMSMKRMWFSSAKAEHDLGYRHRPAREAIADAVRWFRENGYLG